ncbi:MAG: hypothetical protein HKM05_04640 [Spirochaetales bacterium]|nr:hypothetical protein [Spirochaetales bacterium]
MKMPHQLVFVSAVIALVFGVSSCGAKAPGNAPSAAGFRQETLQGQAVIFDEYAQDDALAISVKGVPPEPQGFVLQGWLLGPSSALNLGLLTPKKGRIDFHWNSPQGKNLVHEYTKVEATWEPVSVRNSPTGKVVFSGKIPLLGQQLFQQTGKAPQAPAIGLQSQVDLSAEHAGMARAAAQLEDWSEMKAHLEHVINILEGRHGALFGDYLGTGVPQNPGDGWGAKTYAEEVKNLLSSAGQNSVNAVYQKFQAETSAVENTCLAMLKHFQVTKVPTLLAELTKTVNQLKAGPAHQLYQFAQQTLTIPLESPQ